MPELMTESELSQWILRRLGGPFFKVELTADHLQDAIDQAKRWFAARKGVKKAVLREIYGGVVEYPLEEDVDTVLDVIFPANPMDISMIFSPYILQDEKVPYDVFAAPSSLGLYSSYTQTIQYVETAKRVLSADQDWRQEGRTLHIFPIPKANGYIRIEYKSHTFTIEQLPERDHEMLKRYALACAKMDLGEIRDKYSDFAAAQGQSTLNGAKLKQEAADAKEKLDKEIWDSALPMGWLVG